MTTTQLTETEVLIIGGGPVGLALSNELGWRGVPHVLVEQGDGEVVFPAGESIFARTMEHLRRWGIADEARGTDWPPPDYPLHFVFMTTVSGHELVRFENPSNAQMPARHGDHSPEGPLVCAKFRFDPLLRRTAEQWPTSELRYGQRLESFTSDGSIVEARITESLTDEVSVVRARWMVGCDGGRSEVRRQLGIEFDGTFSEGRNFAVFFRAPGLLPLLRTKGVETAAQIQTVRSARRPYITVVDGRELWRLSAYVDAVPSMDDAMGLIREAVGADLHPEIIRAQPWSGHAVIADRYSVDNVYIAGDAAHLLWPKGGFGANTGIGDAVDLGWKFAATLGGWAGSSLLRSYEDERRPIAQRNVREAASNRVADSQIPISADIDAPGPVGLGARAELATIIRSLREKEYRTLGIQLGYRYAASKVCWYDGSAPPPDDASLYIPSTVPGCRAPHLWLNDGTSILDTFGRGFVLVAHAGSHGTGTFERAARDRGIPLSVVRVGDVRANELYERSLTLVRPDGHVAWRGDTAPRDPVGVLDRVVGRATSSSNREGPIVDP